MVATPVLCLFYGSYIAERLQFSPGGLACIEIAFLSLAMHIQPGCPGYINIKKAFLTLPLILHNIQTQLSQHIGRAHLTIKNSNNSGN